MAIKSTNFQSVSQKDIDQRRAMAALLMKQQRPMGPPQGWNSMTVTPAYSGGQALADALSSYGPALAGVFADNQANKQQKALDTKTTDANQALIKGLSGDATNGEVSQQSQILSQLLQGQDPQQVRQYLIQQYSQKNQPNKYEHVDLGDAVGGFDPRSGQVVAKTPKGIAPDARLSADTTMRGQDLTAGTSRRGQDVTMRGQDTSSETTRRGQDISAETARRNAQLAADTMRQRGNGAKEPVLNSLDYVADKMREALKNTPTGGAMGIKGRAGSIFDYQDASEVDNLRQQLSTELRTIFRIPGEGALSDKEQEQYGMQLPDRKFSPEINEKIITDIQNRARLRMSKPLLNQEAGQDNSFDMYMNQYLPMDGGAR
jgi:hypothetical protein